VTRRYFLGLAIAWGVFAALFAVAAVPIEFGRRSPLEAIATAISVALGLGFVNTMLLAVGVGPLILWLRAHSRRRLAWWHAGLLGATNFALYILAPWLAFGEREDTLMTTLHFWARVPGELLIHAVPAALAGLAFGAWLVVGRRVVVAGNHTLHPTAARSDAARPRVSAGR
jgi:hypothetical protein